MYPGQQKNFNTVYFLTLINVVVWGLGAGITVLIASNNILFATVVAFVIMILVAYWQFLIYHLVQISFNRCFEQTSCKMEHLETICDQLCQTHSDNYRIMMDCYSRGINSIEKRFRNIVKIDQILENTNNRVEQTDFCTENHTSSENLSPDDSIEELMTEICYLENLHKKLATQKDKIDDNDSLYRSSEKGIVSSAGSSLDYLKESIFSYRKINQS